MTKKLSRLEWFACAKDHIPPNKVERLRADLVEETKSMITLFKESVQRWKQEAAEVRLGSLAISRVTALKVEPSKKPEKKKSPKKKAKKKARVSKKLPGSTMMSATAFILDILRTHGPATVAEIKTAYFTYAAERGHRYSESLISTSLNSLVNKGKIARRGDTKSKYVYEYTIPGLLDGHELLTYPTFEVPQFETRAENRPGRGPVTMVTGRKLPKATNGNSEQPSDA